MKYVLLLGRVFYSLIFILASFGHFTKGSVDYAMQMGVPMAQFAVPLSGVIALLGGLSILLGYRAKIGAWLIVIFLVPVTFFMHRFWGPMDPQMAMMQQIMFLKNLSILGGAFIIAYFGAGPCSLCHMCHKQ